MTIELIIVIMIIGTIGIAVIGGMIASTIANSSDKNSDKTFIIGLLITALVIALFLAGCTILYFNNTAEGARALKEQQSNLNNGLNREITIIAADGREVFHYKGRCDIETDHEDNYILFEGEDGLRRMIYYGVTDTVLILEVDE